MKALRKVLTHLLLAVFGLLFVSPALALGQPADAGLPACCRRTGAHHCAMTMAERAMAAQDDQSTRWTTPVEHCPYCPASVATAHFDPFATPSLPMHVAGASRTVLVVRAAECSRRVARERSRHKRGPPSSHLA